MISRKSKYILYILILTVLMIPMVTICSRVSQDEKNTEENYHDLDIIKENERETADEIINDPSEEDRNSEDIKKPLEEFGEFLKELVEEGRQDELEQYIVSRYLTLDEMEEMASLSPAISHFKEYINYQYDSSGVIVIEADVNKDGYLDMIEYRSEIETGDFNQNSITIYKGDGNSHYQIMYYQPHFEAFLSLRGRLSFIQFKGETFLVLQNHPSYEDMITVLYIKDEAVQGILNLEKEWKAVEGEVLLCQPDYRKMAEGLCQNGMEYCIRISSKMIGNAEVRIEKKDEESAYYSEYMRTANDCKNEEFEKTAVYQEKFNDIVKELKLLYPSVAGYGRGYIGDIDNDGKNEIYLKQEVFLNLELSTDRGYIPFITGELFGTHEGKRGLRYYIDKEMKSTDFQDLCGLDIYNLDMIPQIFWVEKQGDENITLIRFIDNNWYENQIRGYLIKDGEYVPVLTVSLIPQIKCSLSYEWREDTKDNSLSYMIHMRRTGSIRHTEIYGLPDIKLQEEINNKMEELLKDKTDQFLFINKDTSIEWDGTIKYAVRYASNEKLAITYTILYRYKGLDRGYGEKFSIEADLITGECMIVDKLTERNYKTEKDIGYYSW